MNPEKGKNRPKNYSFFNNFDYYVPGVKDVFILLLWLISGVILGSGATFLIKYFMPNGGAIVDQATMLIAFPIQFIPAMMYASYVSKKNSFLRINDGVKLDSSNFGDKNIFGLGAIVVLATLATAFMLDCVNYLMPPMPEWILKLLENLTQGSFIMNFITVVIFAPLFEEWLCRGMVLRGLLNHKCKSGKRMRPRTAIILSALFFAIIHMNPWQAIPAFIIGLLLGYVYYKTGSLKLTMLMHAANNFLALVVANLMPESTEGQFWIEILNPVVYTLIFLICALIIGVCIKELQKIELERHCGNMDTIDNSI